MPETFFFTLQMRTRWFWLAKSSCFLSSTAFRCYVLKVMWKMVCVNSFQVGPGFGEQGCIYLHEDLQELPSSCILENPLPMHSHFSNNLFRVFLPGVTIVIILRLSHFWTFWLQVKAQLLQWLNLWGTFFASCLAKLYLLNCALILLMWARYCSFIANFP